MIGNELTMRGRAILVTCGLTLAASLGAAPAFADPSAADKAAAQGLFDQAKKLLASGNAPEACPKLEESQRLDPGIGTQFNLADCYEKVGKSASAWSTFLEVAGAARTAGQPDRERVARKRAAVFEGKLSTLKIAVPGRDRVQGLELRRDGVILGRAQWDSAVPVDPGQHVVTASAPGRRRWEGTATVRGEGSAEVLSVPVDLAGLEPDAPPPAPALVPGGAEATRGAPRPDAGPASAGAADVGKSRGRDQRTIGIIVGGAGIVGIGVGAVFGALSLAAKGDAEDHCKGTLCDAEGVGLRDDAIDRGTVSTVAFAVGAAALAGGVVLVLTAPAGAPRSAGRPHSPARATVGVGPGGLVARGSW